MSHLSPHVAINHREGFENFLKTASTFTWTRERLCPKCGASVSLYLLPNTSDPARDDYAGRHCGLLLRLRYYYNEEVFYGTEAGIRQWCDIGLHIARNVYDACMYRPTYLRQFESGKDVIYIEREV